jgi:hypothetical protein
MKFAFNVPARVIVDADSSEVARELLVEVPYPVHVHDLDSDRGYELLGFNGEPELLRTCRVCGCTDDMACDEGCEWIAEDLCSTEDQAHLAAREGARAVAV